MSKRIAQPVRHVFRHFTSFRPFEAGPLRITPYLTGDSAFDAHMLLVEAGAKRVFYSGDFRLNGRKGKLALRLTNPENVPNVPGHPQWKG